MFRQNISLTENDKEAIKILQEFLPDKIFDAHAHPLDSAFLPSVAGERVVLDVQKYKSEMGPMLASPKTLSLNIITFPDAKMKSDRTLIEKADAFLTAELDKNPDCVGEIIIGAHDSADDIEKRLVHPAIRGLKCYHVFADRPDTFNADIGEYLPESAWQVAHKNKMCITLHLVKEKSLADKDNLNYIITMAKRYPDAVLILAHAARAFAAWTGIEAVEALAPFSNVWFDFSAVCESTAMLQIVKKAGVSRCMWGSDYPVCRADGKAISLADSFYWIYERDIANFNSKTPIRYWKIALENLMAVRQLCILSDMSRTDVERLFYGSARELFF